MNVFCSLSKQNVFAKRTVAGILHLHMLQKFLMAIMKEEDPNVML
jgi:hypothetical protein